MNRKRLIIAALALSIAGAVGAAEKPSAVRMRKPGDRWEYQVKLQQGSQQSTGRVIREIMTEPVKDNKGRPCFQMNNDLDLSVQGKKRSSRTVLYLSLDGNGLMHLHGLKDSAANKNAWLQNMAGEALVETPLSVGSITKTDTKFDNGNVFRFYGKVLGKSTVTTPAGTFKAYKIFAKQTIGGIDEEQGTYWVDPKMNIVQAKYTVTIQGRVLQITLKLIHADLK